VSDLDGTTISIDELRAGYASDLLAEADVVIAVDVTADEEEVIYGRHAWDLSTATGYEEDLVILRVELDMEAGDLEWLVDTIEAIERGEINADGDSPDIDEDDEV
jgi:hypothetical protein